MSQELSENAFSILTTAVSLAKSHQIKSVNVLKSRLSGLYPNNEEDIDSAIKYWGNHIAKTDLNSVRY